MDVWHCVAIASTILAKGLFIYQVLCISPTCFFLEATMKNNAIVLESLLTQYTNNHLPEQLTQCIYKITRTNILRF